MCPAYLATVSIVVLYFARFYAWHNDLHSLTTSGMITLDRRHAGLHAAIVSMGIASKCDAFE